MRAESWSAAVVVVCAMLTNGAGRVAAQKTPPEPQLKQRPADAKPVEWVDYRMHLDVVATGMDGAPVAGLKAKDFTLLIDKKPVEVTAFSAVEETVVRTSESDGTEKKSSEWAELLLVLDMVNPGSEQVGYIRGQLETFLRMNGGRLAVPTRLVVFTSAGIQMQNQATQNGNALADFVQKLDLDLLAQKSSMSTKEDVERFSLSMKNFSAIAENEIRIEGRKLVVWLGPGWPLLKNDGISFYQSVWQGYFDEINKLLPRLRESRVMVYNVRSFADNPKNSDYYLQYLRPMRSAGRRDSGELSLGVLAVESGGRVTAPSHDVAGEIANCVAEARIYYTLKFYAPRVSVFWGYHSIEVQVNRPDVKARTVTGYYE